jgi:hypothetical protein
MNEKEMPTQKLPTPYDEGADHRDKDFVEMLCAKCFEAQLHIVKIEILHAGTEGNVVTVTSDGVALDPTGGAPAKERGVVVEISYACEFCPGQLSVHRFQFRKGTTLWDIRKEYTDAGTVWRD